MTRAEPLGLLDLVTVMRPAKRLCRTRAGEFSGYEIHHGETGSRDPAVTVRRAPDGSAIGFEKGRIFTSYLHGVFDDDAFRRRFLDRVRLGRGWRPLGGVTARYGTEEALNEVVDAGDELTQVFATQMLDGGKSVPVTPAWGKIEGAKTLGTMISSVLGGTSAQDAADTAAEEMDGFFGE